MFRLIVRLHGLKMQIIHGCRGHHHIPSAGHRLQHGAHIPRTVSQIVVENVIIFMGKHLLHLPGIRPVDDQTSDSVSKIIRRPAACCDRHPHVPRCKSSHTRCFPKNPVPPSTKIFIRFSIFLLPVFRSLSHYYTHFALFYQQSPKNRTAKDPAERFFSSLQGLFYFPLFFLLLKIFHADSNSLKSCSP